MRKPVGLYANNNSNQVDLFSGKPPYKASTTLRGVGASIFPVAYRL